MANLFTQFISSQTVYAIALNSSGQAWNNNTNAFETPTVANWTKYAIAMTEQTAGNLTGIYEGIFPVAVSAAGVYSILFRQQSAGSPAVSDPTNGMLGGQFFWTGSAEAFPLTSATSGMNVNVTTWNGTAVSLSDGLPSVQAANLSGGGPIAINQNTGGTDNLRYVDSSGDGVEGANILIYLATDWPANPNRVQATAVTGSDGRWLSPAFVSSGAYVAVFTKVGADGPDVSAPFSV